MKVNFNNLRKQACYSYDKLCHRLNGAILKNDDDCFFDGYGWIRKGDIVISPDNIQEVMDDLRSLIGSIAMVYEENNEDFQDVYPKDKSMAEFNPEAED